MKPMMPAKSTPLELSTVASGMLPMEPIKVAAATNGARSAFSRATGKYSGFAAAVSARNMAFQNASRDQHRDEPGHRESDGDFLPDHGPFADERVPHQAPPFGTSDAFAPVEALVL